ncbi:FIG00471280: hypothetical protein [hydrothermal vent metagenome]|uniref:Cas10/Cmr2 second palm domain-containing protein n=1 Tax=hydrothermal vent metagenome TaxID=652676 RepID=A0A1W1EEF1_9ZZZZ
MAYLYGASVQGIQDFIFKTNRLQEIVGASEIVKSIQDKFSSEYKPKEVLLNAAGNMKAVFDKEECEKVVLLFPQHVMNLAYGVSISQAVVSMIEDTPTQEEINELEKKLKIQRNKPTIPLDMGLGIFKVNPSTAKPIIADTTNRDKATNQKLKENTKFFEKNANARNFKSLSELSNGKNKIAVIHADGNGLGIIIPKLKSMGLTLSLFSKKLDEATQNAFNRAKDDDMRIRDVILGGDDMVVLCSADDALRFTKNYLTYFEEETQHVIGHKFTACAGIAYMNEKYPFHYAIDLAEELCTKTKKHAKKINQDMAPSSLMFHNIQGSNYQNWKKFVEDELTVANDKRVESEDSNSTVRLDFGPYYLNEVNQPSIETFMEIIELYAKENSPISKLRSWMGELYKSDEYAKRILDRINVMSQQNSDWDEKLINKKLNSLYASLSTSNLIVQKDSEKNKYRNEVNLHKTPIYDILQILAATEVK